MSEPNAAYVAPTYTRRGAVHLPVCDLCGALVMLEGTHDLWHAGLWVALSRTAASAPERS